MSFVKLLLSFAPWVAFLIIARGSLGRVEVALLVALALSVVMAAAKLHRGIIMWVGLVFFTAATIAVVGFHNMWTVGHLGVLANGALALGSWGTLLIRRPFTLEYARQHTDPAKWNDPLFIRVNVLLTAVWASTFTVNTALAAIAAALGSNLLVKIVLAFSAGSRRFGLGFVAGMAAPALVFAGVLTAVLR